jgi:peptidoglycan hydrolase CwlO-like protein
LIADLEKQIAREEQEISKLKKGRASAEETVRRLARQIDSRNQLLDVTERDARKLEVEVARTDSVARGLSASLDAHKRRYAEMVREAYRNYKHNNYLTYLFSSSDFNQVARRITNLREVAAMRERQMEQIVTLSEQVSVERTRLTGQQRALDSVKRSLTTQRTRLQKDSQAARANIKQLSKKEKAALQQKIAREQRLDVAIDELRKLTRGNNILNLR